MRGLVLLLTQKVALLHVRGVFKPGHRTFYHKPDMRCPWIYCAPMIASGQNIKQTDPKSSL